MNIQKKLEKMGIIKVKELDHKQINNTAHDMADKITNTFPILQTSYNEILAKILNCKMYYAKISGNISKVNYIYEQNSIYIDEKLDIMKENEQFFHEIIQYLQTIRKSNGKILRMGLCEFNDFSINGLGINQSMVQYISSKLMNNEEKEKQINNIQLKTISPNSYPLLTNLIQQIIYMIGEEEILQATLTINYKFEDTFLNTFEEKTKEIYKNFDKMLEIKNKIYMQRNENIKRNLIQKACKIYIETQKIIISKYYNNIIAKLSTIQEIDLYKQKFLKHKEYMGTDKDIYQFDTFYNEYKEIIMDKFEKQLFKIIKRNQKNALVLYNNKFKNFFKKIMSYLVD